MQCLSNPSTFSDRTYANLDSTTKLIVENPRMRIVPQVHTRLAPLRYYEPKAAQKQADCVSPIRLGKAGFISDDREKNYEKILHTRFCFGPTHTRDTYFFAE